VTAQAAVSYTDVAHRFVKKERVGDFIGGPRSASNPRPALSPQPADVVRKHPQPEVLVAAACSIGHIYGFPEGQAQAFKRGAADVRHFGHPEPTWRT
jgi:hypothetical protein